MVLYQLVFPIDLTDFAVAVVLQLLLYCSVLSSSCIRTWAHFSVNQLFANCFVNCSRTDYA